MKALDCKDIEMLIDEYCDGECRPDVKEAVEEHISGCADCRKKLDEYKKFLHTVSSARAVLPEEMHDRIMSGVALAKKQNRKKLMIRWAGACAALLCVSVIAVPVLTRMGNYSKDDMAQVPTSECMNGSKAECCDAAQNAVKTADRAGDTAGSSIFLYSKTVECGPTDEIKIEIADGDLDKRAVAYEYTRPTDDYGSSDFDYKIYLFGNGSFTASRKDGYAFSGSYEKVVDDVIIFTVNGNKSEYYYYISGDRISMEYINGDRIFD